MAFIPDTLPVLPYGGGLSEPSDLPELDQWSPTCGSHRSSWGSHMALLPSYHSQYQCCMCMRVRSAGKHKPWPFRLYTMRLYPHGCTVRSQSRSVVATLMVYGPALFNYAVSNTCFQSCPWRGIESWRSVYGIIQSQAWKWFTFPLPASQWPELSHRNPDLWLRGGSRQVDFLCTRKKKWCGKCLTLRLPSLPIWAPNHFGVLPIGRQDNQSSTLHWLWPCWSHKYEVKTKITSCRNTKIKGQLGDKKYFSQKSWRTITALE